MLNNNRILKFLTIVITLQILALFSFLFFDDNIFLVSFVISIMIYYLPAKKKNEHLAYND